MSKLKETKQYFNEENVRALIRQYQETAVTDKDENGKLIVLEKDTKIERQITDEVIKVVKAVIQVYRYYIFEPYDDCVQHGIQSCFTNYMKFTPAKGTAFNFFSIIAKISLLNYTDRRKKHRNHSDVADQINLHAATNVDFDTLVDDMENTLFIIVDEHYTGKKRKKYLQIASILVDYLHKTKKFVSKSDLYSWARSYGMRSIDVHEFITAIKEYNNELFNGV